MAILSRPDPGSLSIQPGVILIPRSTYAPATKVLVTLTASVAASLGTTQIDLKSYNGQSYVVYIEATRVTLNKGTGDFTIVITNKEGKWNSILLGGERIDIYADFSSATNQVFRGRIDAAYKSFDGNKGYTMVLMGRECPEIKDRRIVMVASNATVYEFNKSLVDTWFSTLLTYTSMSTGMTTLLNRQYTWVEAYKIIADSLNKAGYYGYLDFNNNIHTFTEEINSDESVTIGQNMVAVDKYGSDLLEKRNNVLMTGNRVEDAGTFTYVKSKKDSTDIASYWQKDLLVSDNTIDSQASIEADVSLKLTDVLRTDTKGSMTAIHGLPTLRPGQSIYCNNPYCGMTGLHVVHQFTHVITPDAWTTMITFERKGSSQWDIMQLRDDKIQAGMLASSNPNACTDAFVITFGEASSLMSHSDTQELNSVLMLDTGKSSGTATSTTHTAEATITGVELRIHAQDYGACTFQFSVDGGTTWKSIALNTLMVPEATGKTLKVKFIMGSDTDNPEPKIFSAWVGYK